MSVDYPRQIAHIVQKLEMRQPLPALIPAKDWEGELTGQLQNTSSAHLFGDLAPKDSSLGDTVKIGLLLWNDALDDAHTMLQDINTQTGSYWHAIMHRREPDYSNAKYWFDRVGSHPIFPTLRKRVLDSLKAGSCQSNQLANFAEASKETDSWNARQFVDWCQAAEQNPHADAIEFLQRTQVEEIKLLLDYSLRNALTWSHS